MQSLALLLDEELIERSKSELVHFAAAAATAIFCESQYEISFTFTEPGYSSLKEIHKDDKCFLIMISNLKLVTWMTLDQPPTDAKLALPALI
jgi:hypothetical protein